MARGGDEAGQLLGHPRVDAPGKFEVVRMAGFCEFVDHREGPVEALAPLVFADYQEVRLAGSGSGTVRTEGSRRAEVDHLDLARIEAQVADASVSGVPGDRDQGRGSGQSGSEAKHPLTEVAQRRVGDHEGRRVENGRDPRSLL